jgi:transposase
MVGKRENTTKTCPSLTIETYVPKNNFYRRLKSILELNFVYEAVKPFYGKCGQKSIDPVVFFKLLLVGHFENICSDRTLIASSQLRLDILHFLDYKLGERLSKLNQVLQLINSILHYLNTHL